MQMRLRLRPHAGMRAPAWACAWPCAQDKPKACCPSPAPEKFWAGVLKTACPLECEKISPIGVSRGAAGVQRTLESRCGSAACQNRTREGGW